MFSAAPGRSLEEQHHITVNMEDGPMNDATIANPWVSVLIVGVFLLSAPGALFARDRGVNQPRGAGNPAAHPDAGYNQPGTAGNVGRDPGLNQSGATGNVGGAGVDPGFNQPGATGNVAGDSGVNQPGATGNVAGDSGVNQPGAAENRRGIRR